MKIDLTLFMRGITSFFLFGLLVVPLTFSFSAKVEAIAPTTDCVIQNFTSDITVRTDSSLTIVEHIDEDCGSLPDKHGFFRVLPTRKAPAAVEPGGWDALNVTLGGVVDGKGNSVPIQEVVEGDTITWKVGDPHMTISGLNHFILTYYVSNAIAYQHPDLTHDALLWGITGQDWQIPIVHASAIIHFPFAITDEKATPYSGSDPTTNLLGATATWVDQRTVKVEASQAINPGEALAVSIPFPKGLVTPYQPTWWQVNHTKVAAALLFMVVLVLLFIGIRLHEKYAAAKTLPGAIAPEFSPPPNIRPIEARLIDSLGAFRDEEVSATIAYLASKGHLTIAKDKKEVTFVAHAIARTDLRPYEVRFLDALFGGEGEVTLSELRSSKRFALAPSTLMSEAKQYLLDNGLLDATSFKQRKNLQGWAGTCFVVGIAIFIIFVWGNFANVSSSIFFSLSLICIGCALEIYARIVTRRTPEGMAVEQQVRGYKLFVSEVDRYKAKLDENEALDHGFIDELLPYAIAFSLTDRLTNSLKNLYGDEYMYRPTWFIATGTASYNFSKVMNNIASVAHSVNSSVQSNGSGSGFSGGFVGGGGGGSW